MFIKIGNMALMCSCGKGKKCNCRVCEKYWVFADVCLARVRKLAPAAASQGRNVAASRQVWETDLRSLHIRSYLLSFEPRVCCLFKKFQKGLRGHGSSEVPRAPCPFPMPPAPERRPSISRHPGRPSGDAQ